MTSDSPAKVRCRQIGDRDIEPVIGLLTRGFAGRPRDYWLRGFRRQSERLLPPGVPRFGFMLENDGHPVGVVLLLFTRLGEGAEAEIRCNLSSWYVEPAFRTQASLLIFFALKHKQIVYMNVSPAPHTWSTIEAQGFRRYADGQFLSLPSLARQVAGASAHRVGPGLPEAPLLGLPERDLLLDHAAMGCLSLVVEGPDGKHPFVFLPFRVRSGRLRLPIRQLVYCRAIADYLRYAGTVGRVLLRYGTPLVIHDSNGPEPGLVGLFRDRSSPKYFRGPHAPRLGDLAYTERVIFGP